MSPPPSVRLILMDASGVAPGGQNLAWRIRAITWSRRGTRLAHAYRAGAPYVLRLVIQTARLMVGIPDYQAYLKHRHTFHPGEPVMSYRDFFRDRQDACYAVEKGRFRGVG